MGLGAFRDKFISELSTGSRRMVEIATLIANEPKVLILDEPSSGIAQKETEALGPRAQGGAALHRLRHPRHRARHAAAGRRSPTTSSASSSVRVIAYGTPDEVLNHPRVIESYLGTASYEEIGVGGATAPKEPEKPAARRTRRRKSE